MNYEIIISAQNLSVIQIKKNGKTIEKLLRPERYILTAHDQKIFNYYKPLKIFFCGLSVCTRTHKYISNI